MDAVPIDAQPPRLHWGVRAAAASSALVTGWFAFWVGLVGLLNVAQWCLTCEPDSTGDPVRGTLLLLGATALVGATVAGLHLAVAGSFRHLGTVVGSTMALALVAVVVSVLTL